MPLSETEYNTIFEKISEGKSLASCLREIPCSFGKFYDGLKTNKEYAENYARARKNQAESSFEKILSLAQRVESGLLEPQAARVAIDTYKWVAARLHPQVYADKPLLDIGDNSPTEITVRWSSKPKELKTAEPSESMELPEWQLFTEKPQDFPRGLPMIPRHPPRSI